MLQMLRTLRMLRLLRVGDASAREYAAGALMNLTAGARPRRTSAPTGPRQSDAYWAAWRRSWRVRPTDAYLVGSRAEGARVSCITAEHTFKDLL